jgi:beta-phosphoglucomutase
MESAFEAVLFDFDGVLVDSEPIHFACWREVLLPLNIDLQWEFYHDHFIGVSDVAMTSVLAAMAIPAVTPDAVAARYPAKTGIFRRRMREALPFSSGIIDLLRFLDSLKLGVVSSSRRSEVQPVLELGGVMDLLHVTVMGDDVTRHKPDPEPYRKAAELLDVRRVLVVEDSAAGEASGRAAGFEVLRVSNPHETAALVRRRLAL